MLLAFFSSQIVGVILGMNMLTSHLATSSADFGEKVAFLIAEGSHNGMAISVSVMVTGVIIVGFIALLITLKKGAKIGDYLALYGFTGKQFLGFLGLLLLLNVLIEAMSVWLGLEPMSFVDEIMPTAHPLWLLVVAMVVVAPIYEEVMFRGFMWVGLAKSQLGFWGASVLTSLVFALIHGQYTHVELVAIVALAMVFSYARAKSGSLFLPITLHIINNGLAMGLYLAK